ncbi:TrbC family F-type conjugative pilus assembly protein [Geomonas subterranea]|uniref:TrbC family F-type conjugative pilus assembly protein n=1 Tax=Geomonas subterranea TaxID=2847989 RepID=UPI001CD7F3B0|nr:TrbC family F-type conjugative pilus assembly protein [Geomonas fuzhouensis]
MRYRAFVAAVLLLAVPALSGADQTLDAVRSGAAAAKERASQFYLDRGALDAIVSGATKTEEARKAEEIINSPELKQRVEAEKTRLGQEVFKIPGQPAAPYYTDAAAEAEKKKHLAADERIYLFVSSSMPEATLRAYVQDIDQLHDPNIIIVLRGFIGGMREFGPSQVFINNLLKKDRTCEGAGCEAHEVTFEIDPNLYRRFKPTQVPAVVYARGVTFAGEGASEGFDAHNSNVPSNPWWVIYGDASLSYLLGRIAGDANSPVLEGYSESLKKF